MSNIVDFAEALRDVIEAGQEVVEGNVVRIISDNGTEVANAVKTTVTGGNGAASNVYSMTGEVVGGTAVTTGWALLAMDLGTVGAAIAPCLGVLAGGGLYALAPEFWTNISNALFNAGKTLSGKVIGYFNGHNIGFDATTIEIFKQALVDEDFFQYNDEVGAPSQWVMNTPMYISSNGMLYYSMLRDGRYYDSHERSYSGAKTLVMPAIHPSSETTFFIASSDATSVSYIDHWVVINTTTGTKDIDMYVTGTTLLNNEYTFDDKTVHYNVGDSASNEHNFEYIIPGISAQNNNNDHIAWTMIYGDITEGNSENLQPGATYPDDDPFPLKYPDWIPWEYPPAIDPSEMPDIRPTKYPEIEPDPYPDQDPAQNPEPENDPDIIPEVEPDFDLPEPDPAPTPEPAPEPDPDPLPVEPIPVPDWDQIGPRPAPDPVDPNPDPTPSPPTPVPPTPSTVDSNKLFTVYSPTISQLNSLGSYLWDNSLMETIKKIWQNPLDGIISLIQVYATPATSGTHNIILGYLDSGVSAAVVSNQFTTINCGSITLNEDKKNATDYSPYTSLHIFLPFIGITELDVNECMNATITVTYKVDVYTGTCLAEIKITRTKDMPSGNILYTFSGNASQQIPLTSGNATGALSALIGGVTTGLSVASGGGLGVVAGASMVGRSLTHEMFHVSHSGNISANAGIMGGRKPYLIIGRRHGYDANNYNKFYGYPSNKTVQLNNHIGSYVRVKSCRLQTTATQPERDQILQMLSDGIIL